MDFEKDTNTRNLAWQLKLVNGTANEFKIIGRAVKSKKNVLTVSDKCNSDKTKVYLDEDRGDLQQRWKLIEVKDRPNHFTIQTMYKKC